MRVTTAEGGSGIGLGAGTAARGEARRVGRHTTRLSPGASVRARTFGAALASEVAAQATHWMLWAPAAFGVGAAIYFGLPREPALVGALGLAGAGGAAMAAAQRFGRSRGLAIGLSLLAFGLAGFADGALKTRLVAAPIIAPNLHVVRFEGRVIDVASPSRDRARLLIAPVGISRVDPADLPARIRVTVEAGSVYAPGQGVAGTAILNPPPGPASPGAYDFARDAYFDRLGGVGASLGALEPIDLGPSPRLGDRIAIAINAFRWRVARRLGEEMEAITHTTGAAAGLAVTVATSHEGWLAPGAEDDLRGSGLAHMLAIAGLHTAAVSGFMFLALRWSIAAWPWLALRIPGKKLAAVGALLAVLVYLVLSGAHPPAKRAAITAGAAFVAILFDRRAISLHSLALAALTILIVQPEAITQPGFQMSFSATAALVALSEIWPRHTRMITGPWFIRALQGARDVIVGLSIVSFVAGAATAPFAIQHFNRVAIYGLFANLTADFIASAILMPTLVAGMLLDVSGAPWALRAIPLTISAWGAGAILWLGHVFANAPRAVLLASSAPQIALVLAFSGIIFACLWKGRLRWLGLPLAFAVSLWPRGPSPVGWIAADAGNAAVVVAGKVVALKPGKRLFATQSFAQHRGLIAADAAAPDHDRLFDCDRSSCTPRAEADFGGAPRLAAWFSLRPVRPERLQQLCAAGEVVLINGPPTAPPSCAAKLLLSGEDLARHGATEFYRTAVGWRLVGGQAARGQRPWSVASAN